MLRSGPRCRPLLALLAGLALLAFGLVACGGDESDGGSTSTETSATAEPDPGGEPEGGGTTISRNGFDAQQVYAGASPAVVTVLSVFGDSSGPLGPQGGQGSGFVINTDGEIVTNAHVVTDAEQSGGGDGGGRPNQADEVFVEFADRNQVPAEILGVDLNADISLLKIDPADLAGDSKLQAIDLGDSDAVEVGTPVAAIGSPFGQDQSLSTGIVSATNRAIQSLTDFRIDGGIQTDASINPGNSGGPLINGNGEVVGVNQQINTTSGGNEGVGFAVPSNLVKRSIEDLRDDGKAEYPYIGVESVPLYPQLADQLEVDAPTGSLIINVTADSPASEAGLQGAGDQTIDFQGQEVETGGDVIVGIEGEGLVGESDLSRLISAFRPGDEITVQIIRDGKQQDVKIKLAPRPVSLPS